MKRYKLKKDLPTFKAGDEFHISKGNNLVHTKTCVVAYMSRTLKAFPNILKDWFEEIPEQPKIVNELKYRDTYWFISNFGTIVEDTWLGYPDDYARRDIGNCFLTKEEAEKELARRKARVILERDTKVYQDRKSLGHYQVYLIHFRRSLGVTYRDGSVLYEGIRFATSKDAEESIRKHEKEWKIYLGVEDAE